MSKPRPLRVCLASLRFYPAYAGPAVRFQRYAPGLRFRGIDTEVFTCSGEFDGTETSAVTERWIVESVNGLPIIRAPIVYQKGRETLRKYGQALLEYCSAADSRPHVVQLLTLVRAWIPTLMRLRRQGIPVVYTDTMVSNPGGPAWLTAIKYLLDSIPFRFVDATVTSSTVMRDTMIRRGVRGRIEVIPNGVDLERFAPAESLQARAALRHRLGYDSKAELVLFVGSLIRRKGVDVLADAWSRIASSRAEARLVLVSPGFDTAMTRSPDFVMALVARLKESGAWDRVDFRGPIDNVEDYMKAADVFAFPSRREGMPNVVPEAFAAGLPTVVAPFVGLPDEFGEPGREYLLVDRTGEAFARAIHTLLDDAEARRRLGQAARSWAETQLSLDVSLDRYSDLYRELGGAQSWRASFSPLSYR